MRGSNLVVEFCTVLAAPVVVAGVSAFVCSSQVSAREHHGISHAHFSAHHVMPIAASNAAFGLGSFGQSAPDGVSAMPATMAAAQAGVPASLVARIIKRESGGNPRAVHAGNYGLMQIKLGTPRAPWAMRARPRDCSIRRPT